MSHVLEMEQSGEMLRVSYQLATNVSASMLFMIIYVIRFDYSHDFSHRDVVFRVDWGWLVSKIE